MDGRHGKEGWQTPKHSARRICCVDGPIVGVLAVKKQLPLMQGDATVSQTYSSVDGARHAHMCAVVVVHRRSALQGRKRVPLAQESSVRCVYFQIPNCCTWHDWNTP